MLAIARETLQYPEYHSPNWIEGNDYEATDDGEMLKISSEQNTNFRFIGKAREFMKERFDFK